MSNLFWLDDTSEVEYYGREKLIRDTFARAYVINGNDAVAAAISIGYQGNSAKDWAKAFVGDPYVQREIESYTREIAKKLLKGDDEAKELIVSSLYREAQSLTNKCSTRVAALSKLSAILALDNTATQPDSGTDVELTKEEVLEELNKRGLPTVGFELMHVN